MTPGLNSITPVSYTHLLLARDWHGFEAAAAPLLNTLGLHFATDGYTPVRRGKSKDCRAWGYFQSEKYFAEFADVIKTELRCKTPPAGAYADKLRSAVWPVCVHLRRGDYQKPENAILQVCTPAYYARAIAAVKAAHQMCIRDRGRIEVCELHEDGTIDAWQPALEEDFHLSFPTVFDWNGEIWMLPETGSDHSLRLYRCRAFPTGWELVQRFATDEELCDAILLDRRAEALTILCSETKPDNQLYVRYRRYTLRHAVQESASLPPQGPFELVPDETYNLQHRDFDLVSRNAGPLFVLGEQIIHPTQVSSTVDYGLYLQFLARRGSSEIPLCAATPQNLSLIHIFLASYGK